MGVRATRLLRDVERRTKEIDKDRADIQNLKDTQIPRITSQLDSLYNTFETRLQEAEALGVDLTFLKKSVNWDKAVEDIEDDTFFWDDVLGSAGFGTFYGGGF